MFITYNGYVHGAFVRAPDVPERRAALYGTRTVLFVTSGCPLPPVGDPGRHAVVGRSNVLYVCVCASTVVAGQPTRAEIAGSRAVMVYNTH